MGFIIIKYSFNCTNLCVAQTAYMDDPQENVRKATYPDPLCFYPFVDDKCKRAGSNLFWSVMV